MRQCLAGMAAATLLFVACAQEPPTPPNVILITFDTLRTDHLGCYGYERDTSPRLDALARSATRYTRAMATSSWTVPTHASLFTGKYPFEHQARAFDIESPDRSNVNPLHTQHLTLAEALLAEDYATGAFVANIAYLSRRWQLDQGFMTYFERKLHAQDLNEKVFDWLARVQGGPFFLFVNYIDTHTPYNTTPRPGFLDRPIEPDGDALVKELMDRVMPATDPVPEDLVQRTLDQYDTAIANVDEQFGVLIDRLQEMGLYDNTMIVVTSDHGEFFGEHHLVGHSKDVYQEVIWTPLLVKNPWQTAPLTRHDLTSSADVPRMILSQFPDAIAARYGNEFPNVPGDHPVIAELYYSRLKDVFHPVWGHRFRRVRTAIYDWPFKYIHSTDGQHELYQLDVDLAESNNLLERDPDTARRLQDTLDRFKSERVTEQAEVELTPMTAEEIQKLRSLGYIGN